MTHLDLVQRAAQWLASRPRSCQTILTEMGTGREIPDAIGWNHRGESWLVECKRTRADFLAGLKKPHRRYQGIGLGRWRYYMTPGQLILPEELPARWGLIVLRGKTCRVPRHATPQPEHAVRDELGMLAKVAPRVRWGSSWFGAPAVILGKGAPDPPGGHHPLPGWCDGECFRRSQEHGGQDGRAPEHWP